MGDYTRIGLVRSATGWKVNLTPSGTTNFCIQRGEAVMKKYLGITPASNASSLDGTNFWVVDAATNFAAHYLAARLFSQQAPNTTYQGQTRTDRGSRWGGYATAAEYWWAMGARVCDLHGRNIIIQRVEP